MVYSMTGYGQASIVFDEKIIKVDIRTLNGKSTDVRIKSPTLYKSKEIEIRNMVIESCERGKIDVTIFIDSPLGEEQYKVNKALITHYYNELSQLSQSLGNSSSDLLQSVMRIPNVVAVSNEELSDEEWQATIKLLNSACENLVAFRKQEGASIYTDMLNQIETIASLLKDVPEHEQARLDKLRLRLQTNLEQELDNEKIDKNRFEQEMFYYVEKLDISEEKVRLSHHCDYFKEVLNNSDSLKGRKLSFISQELGREINTLGAKAQDTNLQKIVVNMKDSLEKIKEQIANVL